MSGVYTKESHILTQILLQELKTLNYINNDIRTTSIDIFQVFSLLTLTQTHSNNLVPLFRILNVLQLARIIVRIDFSFFFFFCN